MAQLTAKAETEAGVGGLYETQIMTMADHTLSSSSSSDEEEEEEYRCLGPNCISWFGDQMRGKPFKLEIDCSCEFCPQCCTCNTCKECGAKTRKWQLKCSKCLNRR